MKTLIVYDSVFGNTEKVAWAMHAARTEAEVCKVSDVKPGQLAGVELLIVGSPTRGFRPTAGMSGFVKNLPAQVLKGVKVAAFDTRIAEEDTPSGFLRFMIGLFGYAAKPIAGQLVMKGGQLAAPPEGFYVKGTEGPLKEGELERAAEWAKGIK